MDSKLVFSEVYKLYSLVNSRVQLTDVTVTNWSVQSIANRPSSYMVEVVWTTPEGKQIGCKLSNWMPARDGAGYDGEKTSGVKRNAGLMWDKIASCNFKNPDRELTALFGYLFDQILTGSALSGESAFKVGMLNAILKHSKPKNVTVSIKRSALQAESFTFELSHIKSIVQGLLPRWAAIEKLPARERSRGASSPSKVDF